MTRTDVTSTPASRSLLAYFSPSSRRTSASSVMTSVVGSPFSWSREARSGEAWCSARWAGSVVYASQNHFMPSRVR